VGDARVESSRALAGDLAAREPRPAGASGNRTTSVEYVLTGTRSRMVRRGADVAVVRGVWAEGIGRFGRTVEAACHASCMAWLDGDIKAMHVFVFCQADSPFLKKKKRNSCPFSFHLITSCG
jgi:hypothetical protein